MADYISQITLPNNNTYNIKATSLSNRTASSALTGTGTVGQYTNSKYYPAKWTFNSGADAVNGDIVTIKLPCAGHDYGVFMSVDNGAHYYPVVISGTSRVTTHYPNGGYITVIFNSSGSAASMFALEGQTSSTRITVTGGAWQVLNYYDSGNTTAYMFNTQKVYKVGSTAITAYDLIAEDINGYLVPAHKIAHRIGSPIFIRTSALSANAASSWASLWSAYHSLTIRKDGSDLSLTTYAPVFLKGTISGGIFTPDTTTPYISTKANCNVTGAYYMYIGDATGSTTISYDNNHPYYYYNGTNLVLYSEAVLLSGVIGADDLQAIEAISETNGLLKKTAANTWTLDTNSYVTSSGVTKVSTGAGLTGGDITTSGTIKAMLKSETKASASVSAMGNTSSRYYAVGLDKDGYLAVNIPWVNTEVTSAANHYTPSRDNNADISVDADGATANWGIDIVTGVTAQTDGKGHITNLLVNSGKIPVNPILGIELRDTDWNTLKTESIYYCPGDHGCTNTPSNFLSGGLRVTRIAAGFYKQEAFSTGGVWSHRIWSGTTSTWTDWKSYVMPSSGTLALTTDISSAINALDGNLNNTTPGAGKTLTAFSQTDGKINATFGDISITKSQISDFSHTHGNITNDGKMSGSTVSGDVATTDKFLREDGTWTVPAYTTNTDSKVSQTASTTSKWRKILLGHKEYSAYNTAITGETDVSYEAVGIAAQPSTGSIRIAGSLTTGSSITAGGLITAQANKYTDGYTGALNMSNSNIYGVNSIYTADVADNAGEGIHFYRSTTTVDSLWINGGNIYFAPNRTITTDTTTAVGTTAANSEKVLRLPASITGSRVVYSDGSNGKLAESTTTSTELGYVHGVTSAIQTQLDTKAPLASPEFTGTPTAPTPQSTSDGTMIATKAYVDEYLSVADAMIFKGILEGTDTVPSSGYSAGWVYKAGANGQYITGYSESQSQGDLVIAIADAAENQSAIVPAHWYVLHQDTNTDQYVKTYSYSNASSASVYGNANLDQPLLVTDWTNSGNTVSAFKTVSESGLTYNYNTKTLKLRESDATFQIGNGTLTATNYSGNAASASYLSNSAIAIQTGSNKKQSITLETLMTWLITTKKYIPSNTQCYKYFTTTWAYADNDILKLNCAGTNYELQLAGCIIEFIGYATNYNSGIFRLRIHSSPTLSFTATSGYTKFPVSSIAEYTCNGSGYTPIWKMYYSAAADSVPTLTWGNTSTIGSVNGQDFKVTAMAKPTPSDIGAATSGHTHTLSIAEDSGTNALTLAYGKKYKLTAGGSTYIFTMPAADNTNTATAANNILAGSNSGTQITYKPYTAQQTDKLSFDTSTTNPSRTDRLNLNGYLYATKLYSGGTEVSISGHTHNYAGSSTAGGAATAVVTTTDITNDIYLVGVKNGATTTLLHNTEITMNGGVLTATTFSGNLSGNATTATTATNLSAAPTITKEGTADINLAAATVYTLSVGGKSIAFKTPSDANNVTQQRTSSTTESRPLLFSYYKTSSADSSTARNTYWNSNIYVIPSTGTIYATAFNGSLTGDVTGNASSATALANSYTSSTRPTNANITHVTNGGIVHFKATSSMNTNGNKPAGDGNILHFHWDTGDAWDAQLYVPDYSGGSMQYRGSSAAGTWGSWKTLLDSNNYNSYAPTLTGTGASGSWGISVTGSSGSCTGNATTATNATNDSDGNAINSTYFKLTETRTATTSNTFSITNNTDSSSTATGALKVSGGVGIAKTLYVGTGANITGITTINNTTAASTAKGSSQLQIMNTTAASGNVVALELYRGATTSTTNGWASWQLAVDAGVFYIRSDWGDNDGTDSQNTTYSHDIMSMNYKTGIVNITATADSSSSSTGALVLDGGLGVAKKIYTDDTVSAKSFVIPQNNNAIAHISFGRSTYNYITIPSAGELCISGGGAATAASIRIGITTSSNKITSGYIYPGVTNKVSLGSSDLKWSNVYATTFTGTATNVTTTADTTNTMYLVGVKSGATTTLLHDTKITAAGSVLTIDTLTITGGATNASMSSTGTLTIGNATKALTLSTTTAALTISTTDGALEAKSTGTGTVKLTGNSGDMTISTVNGNMTVGPTGTGTLTVKTNSGTLTIQTTSGDMSLTSGGTVDISSGSSKALSITSGSTMSLDSGTSMSISSGSGKTTLINSGSTMYLQRTSGASIVFCGGGTAIANCHGRFNPSGNFQLETGANAAGTQNTHKLYVKGDSAFEGKIAFATAASDVIANKAYMQWNETDLSIDFIFA